MTDEPSVTRATLRTDDGIELVAEITAPGTHPARAAASIAHPHPQYGGTMHDAVVMTLDRVLLARGVATVRFAFRGTGCSTGRHDGGPGERRDARAALAHAATLAPGRPLLACGYSFGAAVTLACRHPALSAWVAVAPPLTMFEPGAYVAAEDPRPTHLIVAERDQYASPDATAAAVGSWAAATVRVVPGADHFFRNGLDPLTAAIEATLDRLGLNLQ